MKARRLEEVLDECLSAYLDGRRTVEESLSLYPDLRPRLEPLLRTATELADRFGQSAPPPHIVERGRQRFLESADIRRRARELTLDIPISRRMANVWGRVQWGALAGSIVALFLVVSFTATALDSGSRETSPQAQVILDPRPPAVTDLRETQEQLRVQTAQHGSVSRRLIEDLAQTTAELQSQVQDFDELDGRSQRELERAIGYQYLLLQLVIDTQPRTATPEAREALDQTRDLAEEWGVDLPDPVATASATPLASPSATPAGSATPGSSPGGTATATPGPSLAPTPTPTAPSPDTLPLP
jgi:hypothetical protein